MDAHVEHFKKTATFESSYFKAIICLALLISFTMISIVWAAPVGQEAAGNIAQDWAYLHGWHLQEAGWTPTSQDAQPTVEFAGELKNNADEVVAFKYRFPTGGEVVVVNEDGMSPIFFYSETNAFDPNANPTAKYLFECMVSSLTCTRENDAPPSTDWSSITNRAQSFRTDQILSKSLAATTIGPLIETQWSQSPYYNQYCPSIEDEGQCIVGCVATAMAQILKYWEKPAELASQTISYTTETNQIVVGPVDISSNPLDWDNMPNQLSSRSSQTQINAVAWLSYVCGLTVHMDYGVEWSGAYTVAPSSYYPAEDAFRTTFGYEDTIGISRSDNGASWDDIMQWQIEKGLPIEYSGRNSSGGHAFILDGSQDNGQLFHFNLGWGGSCDGWYNSATPAGGCISDPYSQNQAAIIEISQGERYSLSVNVSPQGAGAVLQNTDSSNSSSIDEDSIVRLKALSYSGYVFDHWAGDASGTDAVTTITVDSDKLVTAVFVPGYRISMHCHGEGSVGTTPDATGFTSGETVTLQANPAAGWMFDHWECGVSGTDNPITLEITGDHMVHAYFVPSHTVMVVPTGQGSVSRDKAGPGYKTNTQVTLTATPAEGWTFRKWWGSVDSSVNPITINVDGNMFIQAEFVNLETENCTLSIANVGNGEVTPFGGSFVKDSVVTLTATPEDGWEFVQWRGDIISDTNPLDVTMSENKCLTAVFAVEGTTTPLSDTVDSTNGQSEQQDETPDSTVSSGNTDTTQETNLEIPDLLGSCTLLATIIMTFIVGAFYLIQTKD